jgi:predicted ATPase/class 3 adenylate cyclase
VQGPTGTIVIGFTDVEGSTLLWERDPVAMRAALDLHDAAMRDLLRVHGGYEVKTEGDAFMVAFAVPAAAVRWALEVQRVLVAADWPPALLALPEAAEARAGDAVLHRGLRVRAGLHLGAPECRPDPNTGRMDYFGPVVNRAARVAAAAHGGQVLVSEAVPVAGVDDLVAEDLGSHHLKGLFEPERLRQILPAALGRRRFPPVRTVEVRRTNVSGDAGLLCGRAAERAAIDSALAGGAAVVTLVGPGGAGKTRLARAWAAGRAAEPPEGGLWWCDLAEARTGADIAAAVGAVLGVTAAAADPEAASRIGDALAARGPTVLLLDNLEQVVAPAAELVARWVGACPEARFLSTSRERLAIAGEVCVEVAALEPDAAVELFENRARAAAPGFALDGEQREIVARLARRLDYLPLALELAAARVAVLGPAQLLERIEQRFELLRSSRRDAPGRHASLRAAIDASWELLSGPEREALRQCTVFRGGFDIEAAEATLRPGDGAEPALELIQALRDKSLLFTTRTAGGVRFQLYESVRAYLGTVADPDAEERAARHLVALADGGADLARVTAEADNLRAVTERFAERDPLLAARAALALDPVLSLRGPVDLHRRLLDLAVERSAGDALLHARARLARAHLGRLLGRLEAGAADLDAVGAPPPAIESRWCTERGALARMRGADAAPHLERALEVARARGDLLDEAIALDALAALDQDRGLLDRARERALAAVDLAARSGDARTEGRLRQNLGAIHQDAGDLEAARRCYERALAILVGIGDRRLEGVVLSNLGNLSADEGDDAAARRYLAEALPRLQEAGDRRFVGNVGMYEGIVLMNAGDLVGAQAALERALAAHRDAQVRLTGLDRGYLGVCALLAGDPAAAASHLAVAVDTLGEVGDRGMGALFCAFDAARAARQGDAARAEARLAQARALQGQAGGVVADAIAVLAGEADPASQESHVRLARAVRARAPDPV